MLFEKLENYIREGMVILNKNRDDVFVVVEFFMLYVVLCYCFRFF